jgi:hypothetical protein
MRPRDWFAVGVRLIGVYAFYRAVIQWLGVVGDFFYQASRSEAARELDVSQSHAGYVAVFAVGLTVLSYVLIFGAERLTRWSFNEPAPDEETEKVS